ncbi:MAG: glycosyltransferase family 39 protein [Acidobacteriota bacterium]
MTEADSRRSCWHDLRDPWLLGALALGLALRAASLGHGLPHVYNPDEVSILSRALSLASGDLNPHNFLYPTLYFYLLAAATGAYAAVSMAAGQSHSLAQFETLFWQDPTAVYVVGRLLSVAAGVATIFAVYRLALRVGDRATARIAALLVAVAYIPVRDAHFLKHDVPATFLIVLAVLASWWVWQRGLARDYAVGGAAVGIAFAFHYPAALAAAALLAAHLLRAPRSVAGLLGPRTWLAVAAFAIAFAVCSPYVLLDPTTALRDIQANRAIIVDRAQHVFGLFGSALPQLEILATQGTGIAWLVAAVVGGAVLARQSAAAMLWLASFPVVFVVLISNTWPFGRTANPLYPFLAVMAAVGIVWVGRMFGRRSTFAIIGLASIAVVQPLATSVLFDYLMAQTDTRTLASQWIEAHLPAGASVAVEPYSVQLETTREQLSAAMQAAGARRDRGGRRSHALLARTPYPSPAYRLFYVGDGGMDDDKIYLRPLAFSRAITEWPMEEPCIDYVALKSAAPYGTNPLSPSVARYAQLAHTEDPFAPSVERATGFLPDFDVTPSLAVQRPGPRIDVWQIRNRCHLGGVHP